MEKYYVGELVDNELPVFPKPGYVIGTIMEYKNTRYDRDGTKKKRRLHKLCILLNDMFKTLL